MTKSEAKTVVEILEKCSDCGEPIRYTKRINPNEITEINYIYRHQGIPYCFSCYRQHKDLMFRLNYRMPIDDLRNIEGIDRIKIQIVQEYRNELGSKPRFDMTVYYTSAKAFKSGNHRDPRGKEGSIKFDLKKWFLRLFDCELLNQDKFNEMLYEKLQRSSVPTTKMLLYNNTFKQFCYESFVSYCKKVQPYIIYNGL